MGLSKQERYDNLMPLGVPRYVRCYESTAKRGEGPADRYQIVFTSKRGGYYVSASDDPTLPTSVYLHNDGRPDRVTHRGRFSWFHWPPAVGKVLKHMGRRIKFTDLPFKLRVQIAKEYCELWDIPTPGWVELDGVTQHG